jgi:hypothetical protein
LKKIVLGTLAVLALSGSAFAWEMKDNAADFGGKNNAFATTNAQITKNGFNVGGNKAPEGSVWVGGDQTTAPQSRSSLVQGALNHEVNGQGSTNGVGNGGVGHGHD